MKYVVARKPLAFVVNDVEYGVLSEDNKPLLFDSAREAEELVNKSFYGGLAEIGCTVREATNAELAANN